MEPLRSTVQEPLNFQTISSEPRVFQVDKTSTTVNTPSRTTSTTDNSRTPLDTSDFVTGGEAIAVSLGNTTASGYATKTTKTTTTTTTKTIMTSTIVNGKLVEESTTSYTMTDGDSEPTLKSIVMATSGNGTAVASNSHVQNNTIAPAAEPEHINVKVTTEHHEHPKLSSQNDVTLVSEKTSSSTTAKSKKPKDSWERNLRKIEKQRQQWIEHSLENKKKLESLVFKWQQRLFEPSVNPDVFTEAAKYLTPKLYHEVLIERQVLHLCGYPCCGNQVMNPKNKQSITSFVYGEKLDNPNAQFFCSSNCHVSSDFFASQLSTDPIYMRNLSRPSDVEVLDSVKLSQRFDNLVIHEKVAPHSDVSKANHFVAESIEGYTVPNTSSKIQNKITTTSSHRSMNKVDSLNKSLNDETQNKETNVITVERIVYNDEQTLKTQDDKRQEVERADEDEEEEEVNQYWLKPSKKKNMPKLTFFGHFWTVLDKFVTHETKELLKKDRYFFDTLDVHKFIQQQDSVSAERRKIFTEKVSRSLAMIKQDYGISTPFEDCLLVLVQTLKLDVSSTMLNALEVYGLAVVILKIFSSRLSSLAFEMEKRPKDVWNLLMKPLEMSEIELKVFVDIFN